MEEWTPPNTKYPPPKEGEPPLHRAARVGDHAAITRLLDGGADVDELFNIGLDPGAHPSIATPLMVAAGSGDGATVDTVRLLLARAARLHPAGVGLTALGCACGGLGWNYRPGGDAARVRE